MPRPKTARPEGGCLTIHRQRHYPLLYWLKRTKRDELIMATTTSCSLVNKRRKKNCINNKIIVITNQRCKA